MQQVHKYQNSKFQKDFRQIQEQTWQHVTNSWRIMHSQNLFKLTAA